MTKRSKQAQKNAVPVPTELDDSRPARQPLQDRGLKRVESILDAAETVIAEVGVEAASTNAIAERAGSSVGSLYHFFPSKEAIVEALARRFAERKREINARAIPVARAHMPLEEVFERVVESHARFLAETPAFIPVYDAVMRGRSGFLNSEMFEAIVGQVRAFLAVRVPQLSAQARETSAVASVSTIHGVLLTAMRLPREQREPLLSELKRMMVAYFEPIEAATQAKSSSRGSGQRGAPRARRQMRSTRTP
ncbi:MAG TPA: TetR/AcrR family transcriptional regulator [Gemmatimonadaceae bacterium]|nr:TetR/AcrR family transcriptional regulator [Gemmatimonadaceae bacterium]